MASPKADAQMTKKTPLSRPKSANPGHYPTVGERLLILKAAIQKSCGNWQAPTLTSHEMRDRISVRFVGTLWQLPYERFRA